MNALEIQGLTKRRGSFTLGPIDLTLPSGCILGLIGENGAGKSTTIKLILEMIRRDSGSIRVLGQEKLQKQDIGVVLDEVGIPACLNTDQVGRVMAGIFKNWDETAYRSYLKRLDIPGKKAFSSFSRGMKMKLGIAVALSHHPRLLLLDEPTSGLDPVARDEVVDILEDFTRDEDHAVLISSHIVSDLEKLCDYIAFLHKGQLLLMEEKDRLLEEYGIFRGSREALNALSREAVLYRKVTDYGCQALVRRDAAPGLALGPIGIEELFVCMAKEAN